MVPFVSVIVPTYNRKWVLEKCLRSLLAQTCSAERYEIIVIDDGSTDGTGEMVARLIREWGGALVAAAGPEAGSEAQAGAGAGAGGVGARAEAEACTQVDAGGEEGGAKTDAEAEVMAKTGADARDHTEACPLVYRYQEHACAAAARNAGIRLARGALVIFLDSDIVTKPDFIEAHIREHLKAPSGVGARKGQHDPGGVPDTSGSGDVAGADLASAGVASVLRDSRVIVHGRVIYTTNLDDPTSEPRKLSDISMAFFASTNVSIARRWLIDAGLFDEDFTEYGWEDLELGKRLKKLGLRVVRSEAPTGYHLKHEFRVANLPAIRRREIERGHMAVLYLKKHPTFSVRMTTMIVPPFFWLVALLAAGGWPDRPGTARLLDRLQRRGHRTLLGVLLQIMVYHWYVRGIKEGLAQASR